MSNLEWSHGKNVPNDASGAGTPTANDKDARRIKIDFLSRENQRLATENRTIRRCLILTKENCDLQTLNYLSYALAMNDHRLSKFLTDAAIAAPGLSSTNEPEKGSAQTNPVPGPSFKNTATNAHDSTYGQSFPELQLSDIRSSYDAESVGNSYGKAFPETDPADFEDSYATGKANFKSPRELSVKWVDPDGYSGQMSNPSDSRPQQRYTSGDRNLKSIMKQPSPKFRTNETDTREETQGSRQTTFYDSMEASQRRQRPVSGRTPAEVNQPPMKFGLNPNPLIQDPYGMKILEDRRRAHSARSTSPPQSNKRITANQSGVEGQGQSVYGIEGNLGNDRSLHISDLSSESQPSAFRKYKGDTVNAENGSYPNATPNNQNSDIYNSEKHSSYDTNYRAVSMGISQGQSQGLYTSVTHQQPSNGGSYISSAPKAAVWKSPVGNREYEPARALYGSTDVPSVEPYSSQAGSYTQKADVPTAVSCGTCQPNAIGQNASYAEKGMRCPHCKHLLQDNSQQSEVQNTPLLVRVNTTLGRSDDNEKIKVSDLYAIPTGTRTPSPTLLDRSVSNQTRASGNSDFRLTTPSVQLENPHRSRSPGRSVSNQTSAPGNSDFRLTTPNVQLENSHRSRSPYSGYSELTKSRVPSPGSVTTTRSVRTTRIVTPPPGSAYPSRPSTPTKYTSMSESKEVMRHAPEYGTNRDSMFHSNRELYRSERSDYKTSTEFEQESRQTVFDYDGSIVQGATGATGSGVSSYAHDSAVRSVPTMIGSPMAASTPNARRQKQNYMKQDQQRNSYSNQDGSIYETAQSTMYTSHQSAPRASPRSPRATDVSTHSQRVPPNDLYNSFDGRPKSATEGAMDPRYSSTPPVADGYYDNSYNVIGVMPTGLRTEHAARIEAQLAKILGFSGQGAAEKVKGYLYRAVDILTGYRPLLTSATPTMLEKRPASRRMVGEIAFQLDRRLLEFVIAGYPKEVSPKANFRYYGYSLTNIFRLIKKEATVNGNLSTTHELSLRRRFDYILNKLKPFGYDFNFHAEFTQDMVNKYGLLNISSSDSAIAKYDLKDIGMIRLKLCQLMKIRGELDQMMIIFDCLCCLSYEDRRQLFIS